MFYVFKKVQKDHIDTPACEIRANMASADFPPPMTGHRCPASPRSFGQIGRSPLKISNQAALRSDHGESCCVTTLFAWTGIACRIISHPTALPLPRQAPRRRGAPWSQAALPSGQGEYSGDPTPFSSFVVSIYMDMGNSLENFKSGRAAQTDGVTQFFQLAHQTFGFVLAVELSQVVSA